MYTELCLFLFLVLIFYYFCYLRFRHKSGKLPPGPWGIPYFGYLPFMGKVPCQTLTELAKKYGALMTLQMGQYPVVFVNDLETMREIFKMDALTGRAQLELFERRGYYGLGLLEGKDWMEVRRFMMRCLRDLGFGKKSMESALLQEVQQCTLLLREHAGKSLYMKPLLELSVINALWGLMTGEKYDIQDPIKSKITDIMSEGISEQNIVGIAAFLPNLAKLFPNLSGYNKGMEYFGAPEDLAREIIEKHAATYSSGNDRDFVDVGLTKVYNTIDPNSQFYKERGMKNLHYTIIDLFFAGSDTMSSTLGWAFMYLATWPEVQLKLHAEIDAVVGKSNLPSLQDRHKMPYTEATMAEVLRKSTLVPLGLFHTAIEDFEYDGYLFPKRTAFLANLYKIHHDPLCWGDPEVFRPERFLTETGAYRKDEHMIPFFTGKRTCPGEGLAMMEFFLFLVGIMQKFSFSLNPDEPMPDLGPKAGFIMTPPKYNLCVHERK